MRTSNTAKGIAIWLLLLHTCQFALMGCGGSGGSDDPDPVLTSRQIAQKFASADGASEKRSAFNSLFDKLRIGSNDNSVLGKSARPTSVANQRISQVLADEDHLTRSPMKSLSDVYDALERPEYGVNFTPTVGTIVSQLNTEISQMQADPESPNSCLLLLMSYDPENPNATPGTMTSATQLTAIQGIAFGLWAVKFADGVSLPVEGRWIIFPLLLTLAIISVIILIVIPFIPDLIEWLEDLIDDHDQGPLGRLSSDPRVLVT